MMAYNFLIPISYVLGDANSPVLRRIGTNAEYNVTAIKIAATALTSVETAVHFAKIFAVTSAFPSRNRLYRYEQIGSTITLNAIPANAPRKDQRKTFAGSCCCDKCPA